MTNVEVAQLLEVSVDEVEDLAEELGVPDDSWTVGDLYAADKLLDEEEDDDE